MKDKSEVAGSGYKINNIIMMESSFKRIPQVTIDKTGVETNINIDISPNIAGNTVSSVLTIDFTAIKNGIKEIESRIAYVGIFEKVEESKVSLEDFGLINGGAILFAYVREHLSLLSLKAAVGQIILPPFNFVENAKKIKEANKERLMNQKIPE